MGFTSQRLHRELQQATPSTVSGVRLSYESRQLQLEFMHWRSLKSLCEKHGITRPDGWRWTELIPQILKAEGYQ